MFKHHPVTWLSQTIFAIFSTALMTAFKGDKTSRRAAGSSSQRGDLWLRNRYGLIPTYLFGLDFSKLLQGNHGLSAMIFSCFSGWNQLQLFLRWWKSSAACWASWCFSLNSNCWWHKSLQNTLPETNIAPENGWLEYEFRFGKAYFLGLC